MTPLLSLLADALAHPAASDRGAALRPYVDDPQLAADTLAALREASAAGTLTGFCAILARRTDGVGNVDACGVLDDVLALVRRGSP